MERERETETERRRDRQTDTDTQRETQRERETEKETEKEKVVTFAPINMVAMEPLRPDRRPAAMQWTEYCVSRVEARATLSPRSNR